MRRIGILFALAAMALVTFSMMGSAQQGGKKGKGGGFGGGFGAGGMPKDPLSLLTRADVKKELDLSEEQVEKLPGAVMKAVATVLNDKQMKRFRQIELQVQGPQAFVKDQTLRTELKLQDSQVKNIEEILAETKKETDEIMKEAKGGGGGGGFKGIQEKLQGINKEAKEKVMGVLTADQKKQYKELVGEEFKFENKGFGKKKADTN